MEYLQINGGHTLGGIARIQGAKNSALPILTASLMLSGKAVIHNCPRLSDTENTLAILQSLGAKVQREGNTVTVDASDVNRYEIAADDACKMRSSILFLSAISARMQQAYLSMPGGCRIGRRPIDMHLNGLAQLGYRIIAEGDRIGCRAENAHSDTVVLPYPSVGATENLIMAAVLLPGETTIINAAREPEIEDLCRFLNGAGAAIKGASQTVIKVVGVQRLGGAEHTVIPDRIAAATMLAAAAVTGSELTMDGINHAHMQSIYPMFTASRCRLFLGAGKVHIQAPKRLKAVKNLVTKPYPGFPTDCQAPAAAMLLRAKGASRITETVFEDRFSYTKELQRFGAVIQTTGNTVTIDGVRTLTGADAICTDLRGGAAIVLAALAAEGTSRIRHPELLDRGYEAIENQLSAIGAVIVRKNDEKEGRITEKTNIEENGA